MKKEYDQSNQIKSIRDLIFDLKSVQGLIYYLTTNSSVLSDSHISTRPVTLLLIFSTLHNPRNDRISAHCRDGFGVINNHNHILDKI